jgi:two-component system sensor histidine kinase UhpB
MERLRQISEHINGVLWLGELGAFGESFLYVSPRYDEVWGLDRTELRDRPRAWLEAVHPDDRGEVEAHYAAAARHAGARGTATIEYRLVHASGAIRWIRDYTFPIRDVDGQARRIARLSQDVTVEREAATAHRMRELARSVQATREEERRRIARELHDELGGTLTGIKLRLAGGLMAAEVANAHAPGIGDGPAAGDGNGDGHASAVALEHETVATIRAAIGDVDGAMASVRSLIHQLHPPILDEVGLVAALRLQASSFASRTGIACDLDLPEAEPELSGEELSALFRVAQESLTNVARHAGATRVEIRLAALPSVLRLHVADDGRGVGDSKRGFGMRGMSERAAVLNGTLRIEPRPERGTLVQLEIPRHAGGGPA